MLALVCVLGIFFCPVVSGPYSAVHGPVTALLSIRAAARLRMTIVRGGLGAIRGWFGRLGAALAMLSPAMRASRIDPSATLREE